MFRWSNGFIKFYSFINYKSFSAKSNSSWIQKGSSPKTSNSAPHKRIYGVVACFTLASIGYYHYYFNYAPRRRRKEQPGYAILRPDLPTYSILEVEKHCDLGNSVWVSLDKGVYDVTRYVDKHPGGEDTIEQAAGGSLEYFWHKYPFHRKDEVTEILESMRIGNLEKQDRCKKPKIYPKVNPESYRLELVLGDDENSAKSLNLGDLKKRFPKHSISSTIPCQVKEGEKTSTQGPVWSGALLSDVLRELDFKKEEFNQLQFECLDTKKSGSAYGSTLPIDKAADPKFQVLLAYEMNGNELSAEHGYPVRVVMTRLAGSSNVKWLHKIRLIKKES